MAKIKENQEKIANEEMVFYDASPSVFKRDLTKVQKSGDLRFIVLMLNLYAEHFANDFIRIKTGDIIAKEILTKMGFPTKLRILKKFEWIDKNEQKILEFFSSIRDEMVHNLVVDYKRIEEGFKNCTGKGEKVFDFIIKANPEIKEVFVKSDVFDKLKVSMIWIIHKLWFKFQAKVGRPINEAISLKMGKDKSIYIHFFK